MRVQGGGRDGARPVAWWTGIATIALSATAAGAQAPTPPVQPGAWDVTSKITEFNAPGVPGFVAHFIRGKSRSEHKRVGAGEGVAALLAPDPKAKCHIDDQRIADGRYAQTLSCPAKQGGSMRIARAGSYDAAGFTGTATVTGATPKGALRIVLDQKAARVGG